MAATPSRPSNNQNTSSNNNYKIEQPEFNDNINNCVDNSDSDSVNDTNNKVENLKVTPCSNCKCTNISIMQLFHEMKQEFPKIPDHVVTQCVLDNCHNRNACMDKLRNETISLIQAYPSQIFKRDNVLKGANHNHNNNTSENNTCKNNNCVNNNNSDKKENLSDMSQSPFNKQISQDSNNNVNNQSSYNNSHSITSNSHNNGEENPPHVQRPNTLNFVKELHNSVSAFSKPVIKPRRTAPPPPSSTASSTTSSTPTPQFSPFHQQPQQHQNYNHYQPTPLVDRLAAAHSISTPSPPQPLTDAVVSLNVKVSPVTGRPPIRPRHTSEISIQPQPPFLRDIHPNSRSYTSVHFNLRPPSDNPQSPINITAGPSLTYSSSSFDARQGHQNQLQITIGDGSGLISAMRAQPRQLQVSRSVDDDRGRMDGYNNYNQETIENQHLVEIIQKQLKQKDRLSRELKNNRKHLDSLQREIRALQSPIPAGGSLRLADEITRLQSVCQNMTQEVEEAGVYVIGETNEAFYNNIYTGQKFPIQNRPARPPRPPPPAVRSASQPAANGGGGGVSYNVSPLVSNCSLNNISALTSLNNNNLINNNNNLLLNSHNSNDNNDNNDNNNNHNNHNNHNINNNSEESWICSVCTFQNHPLLDTCEQCDMIKFDSSSNNGGTGMIKITGAQFSPPIEHMRLLQSNNSGSCTPPPALLTPPTTNDSYAPEILTASNNNSPNYIFNGFMLPN